MMLSRPRLRHRPRPGQTSARYFRRQPLLEARQVPADTGCWFCSSASKSGMRERKLIAKVPHPPMIFSVYLQVGDLDRSLSFYRDGLGLEVAWNDDMLAVLRGPDESATLAIRKVGEGTKPGLGQTGVARIGWQVTSSADLDRAEERLAKHGAQYQRADDSDGGRIVTHDPDGLSVVLFLPGEPSLARKPPPFIYWYR